MEFKLRIICQEEGNDLVQESGYKGRLLFRSFGSQTFKQGE
jgi:hypothetical protein